MAPSHDSESVGAMSEDRVSVTALDEESEYIMKFSGIRRFLLKTRDAAQFLPRDGRGLPNITASSESMESTRAQSADSACTATLSPNIESIMSFSDD